MASGEIDVIIVGGGAAGLMCAIEAGRRARRVVVLEHADRVGKKILISGGGRCNFTNIHCKPENFISANPHFAKSALARYTPADFLALVENNGIAWHEKTLGQLFCDDSAKKIVAMLLSECAKAGAEVRTGVKVREIVRVGAGFLVETDSDALEARALVIATGGLSIPKMGATAFGYEVARQFGVAVRDCRPGLVPLVLGGAELAAFAELTGVSADVRVDFGKKSFREKLLFTHRGLSGPVILQISSYIDGPRAFWNGSEAVIVDWAPGQKIFAGMLASSAGRGAPAARAALRGLLSARLADRLLQLAVPTSWTNHSIVELERRLHAWEFHPVGTEGYEKAEVTAGGVDTDALRAQTMECREVPGLYFIGEIVDVTGWLGGFNFQWAWASGAAAGRAV